MDASGIQLFRRVSRGTQQPGERRPFDLALVRLVGFGVESLAGVQPGEIVQPVLARNRSALYEATEGPDHPDTARVRDNLADLD